MSDFITIRLDHLEDDCRKGVHATRDEALNGDEMNRFTTKLRDLLEAKGINAATMPRDSFRGILADSLNHPAG